jgi:hypothetical protein
MTFTDPFGGTWLVCVGHGVRAFLVRGQGDYMDFGRLQWTVGRRAAAASLLLQQAGAHVLTGLAVATAYRRAFRMSREFRRLPA